jgi:hypothetical protein
VNNVITIDDERIKNYLNLVVRRSVEETLNVLRDAAADRLCTFCIPADSACCCMAFPPAMKRTV